MISVPFSIQKLGEIGAPGASSSFYLYIFTQSTLFHFCSVQSCVLRRNWDDAKQFLLCSILVLHR